MAIPIELLDGSTIEVKDCEFDLLLYLLYKHNFDRVKIREEIESICEKSLSPAIMKILLRQSLLEFSSELSNKILSKSITEQIPHTKIIEDMIIDINKIKYTIAETASDMRKVLRLRKSIFVKEEGYPTDGLINGFERKSLHVIAKIRDSVVGVVSIAFDGPEGIPLDRFLDLTAYKDKKVVEVDKLAVIGDKRKRELSFQLMWLSYSIARYWGAERMFIFTLSKKSENLTIYKRFGFKDIGIFNVFGLEKATALKLDFEDLHTYEKKLNTDELLRLGKKLLNRFSLSQQ